MWPVKGWTQSAVCGRAGARVAGAVLGLEEETQSPVPVVPTRLMWPLMGQTPSPVFWGLETRLIWPVLLGAQPGAPRVCPGRVQPPRGRARRAVRVQTSLPFPGRCSGAPSCAAGPGRRCRGSPGAAGGSSLPGVSPPARPGSSRGGTRDLSSGAPAAPGSVPALLLLLLPAGTGPGRPDSGLRELGGAEPSGPGRPGSGGHRGRDSRAGSGPGRAAAPVPASPVPGSSSAQAHRPRAGAAAPRPARWFPRSARSVTSVRLERSRRGSAGRRGGACAGRAGNAAHLGGAGPAQV